MLSLALISAAVISPEIATAQTASVLYDHPIALSARINRNASGILDTRAAQSSDGITHGVIGAASGVIVGAALGYMYVAMHCDNGASCNATRSVLTGAAIGAVVGIIVEYAIRSWPQTAPNRGFTTFREYHIAGSFYGGR